VVCGNGCETRLILFSTGHPGGLVWRSRTLEILFTWMPCLLPKRFCSLVLELDENVQKQLEDALNTRPWVFGFADVCASNTVRYLTLYSVSRKKTCRFIFVYNSPVFWLIFVIFVPLETGMNALQRSYKMFN